MGMSEPANGSRSGLTLRDEANGQAQHYGLNLPAFDPSVAEITP